MVKKTLNTQKRESKSFLVELTLIKVSKSITLCGFTKDMELFSVRPFCET